MTKEQKEGAALALKNASWNLDQGNYQSAEAWAEAASEMICEANLSTHEQIDLVAPHDGATTGDKVVIALSAGVLLWMISSIITGLWIMP